MSRARPAAMLALVALLLFVATALWTQFARADLDWVKATLSLYLHGPWGVALRTAYCLLALAIAVLGIALYRYSVGHGAAQRHRCCSAWLPAASPPLPLVTAGCPRQHRCWHR